MEKKYVLALRFAKLNYEQTIKQKLCKMTQKKK